MNYFEKIAGVLKGKIPFLETPAERLLRVHQEISQELDIFVKQHNFSVYKPNVGVFGENSTGKSTFLNAMLGTKEQFKMGFGETTDKITVLYKGKKPEHLKGFSQLYNKHHYERKNYEHLRYMNLYDIPGFGQHFSHDALSEVLQEIDIVFWFIDASKGTKKDDKLFLEKLHGKETKVIVVLNKVDAVSEGSDLNALKEDINNEIAKIKRFFKEASLEKNLVSVFAFSATKSLVSTIKGEESAFKVVDAFVQNILLYTVFIESYRGFVSSMQMEYYDIEFEVEQYEERLYEVVSNVCYDLEEALKDEISMFTSLNPFNSKDEEAKYIVEDYNIALTTKMDAFNDAFVEDIQTKMQQHKKSLHAYNAFAQSTEIDFEFEMIPFIDIEIDLNSMAWDSFFGDSFAEEVAAKFEKKVHKKLRRQIPEIVKNYTKSVENVRVKIEASAVKFADELDEKLVRINKETDEALFNLLLKAIHNQLEEVDHQYIKQMLEVDAKLQT